MSTNEIAVIIFGLFLGYWIVAKLFSGKSPSDSQNKKEENFTSNEKSDAPSPADSREWHQVLNISSEATLDEIRSAYKTLIGQYHPDKVATLGPELKTLAEQKSKEINVAYRQALHYRKAN